MSGGRKSVLRPRWLTIWPKQVRPGYARRRKYDGQSSELGSKRQGGKPVQQKGIRVQFAGFAQIGALHRHRSASETREAVAVNRIKVTRGKNQIRWIRYPLRLGFFIAKTLYEATVNAAPNRKRPSRKSDYHTPAPESGENQNDPGKKLRSGIGRFCVTPWGRVVQLSPRNWGSYCWRVKSFAALLDLTFCECWKFSPVSGTV